MDRIILVLIVLALGADAALWIRNPMHVPPGFPTARALGLERFHELGSSMSPAVGEGRYVLVSTWSYWNSDPQVGDVVAFAYPGNPALADLKRVVAVPGSTIEIRNGLVYVDDELISQPYANSSPGDADQSLSKRRVPAHSYFVMGDNSERSEDSRDYGVIARSTIIGKQVW